jgi:tRNA 2-thiouridine synthesizing protein A
MNIYLPVWELGVQESLLSSETARPEWAKADLSVDVRGESCPIPELTTSKKLKEMAPAKVLEVLTDNQASVDVTLPDLARGLGYEYYAEKSGDLYRFFIAKR